MKNWRLLTFVGVMLLAACAENEENTAEPVDDPGHTEETEVAEQEPERKEDAEESQAYEDIHPLTGEPTNDVSPYKPIAVMVNNHWDARPQSGLSKADIVYEILTEGDLTRFLAIYHSEQPEKIGPVRSARGYFVDIAEAHDAFFVTHGWSPEAEQMLQNGRVEFLNGLYHDGTLFERSAERNRPHNSYITFRNMLEGLNNKGYELKDEVDPLTFNDTNEHPAFTKQEGDIDISYRDKYFVSFTYNDEKQAYERSSDQEPTMDELENERVSPENVLVIQASHRVIDDKGRRYIDLQSGGDGVLFQHGERLAVTWVNDDGRIVPKKDGEEIPLIPGQTWVNVVPSATVLEDVGID
ncbi:Protein of unknown function [Alteribacillus persepolensis]|uniref:DUF3048 domain-containing protein n=1 Tax=Alteribacillus persepolensis TaxID=568899 RepID=A0A1G8F5N2_9BACI|nr:DUF3048 domain-containing protein [Alteribacillus persepolensis]SDH77440.1 Protein of unknown function [Alteribacillus persepolensis]